MKVSGGSPISNSSARPTASSGMPTYVGFPVSVIIAGFCVMSMAYLICFCCCIIQFFVRRNRNPGSPTRGLAALEGGVHKQKNDKLKRQLWRQFQNSLRRFRKNRPSSQMLADSSCVGFCPICFEEYKGDPAEILVGLIKTCGHFFHFECIWEWLENHRTCPLCRGPAHLRETDIKGLALRHVEAYKECVLAADGSTDAPEVKKVPSGSDTVEAGTSGGAVCDATPGTSSPGVATAEEATEDTGVTQSESYQAQNPIYTVCRPGSIVVAVDIEDTADRRRQDGDASDTTSSSSSGTTHGATSAAGTTEATPSGSQRNQADTSSTGAERKSHAEVASAHDNPAFVVDDEAT